jgi:hypothetical protein
MSLKNVARGRGCQQFGDSCHVTVLITVLITTMTGANYTGGRRWVSQSASNTVLSQPVFSLLQPGTLPERDFATRLVVLRKATLAVGVLKSLAVVLETAHNPRGKSHLAYPESFSNMLRGNFPIYQNICGQTGRKHLTSFLACLRLSYQNTLSNRLKLCTRSTVRAVSPSSLIQFFSRLGGTFSQRSYHQNRSESRSQVFKDCWTLQLSKLPPKVHRPSVPNL